jgi:signal transduction histidine kinase
MTRAALLASSSALALVLAVLASRDEPQLSYAGASVLGRSALILPGIVATAAGIEARRRHPREPYGTALALAGAASFLPELGGPGASSSLSFSIGLVLAWAALPLLASAALGYPRAEPSQLLRVIAGLGYVTVIGLLGVLPALVLDPAGRGCTACRANLLLVHGDASVELALARIGIAAALAWALVTIVVLVVRLARGSEALRRGSWPVTVPAALALTCFAAELVVSLRRGFLSTEHLDRELWRGEQAALLTVAAGVCAGWLRTRRSRRALAQAAVELAAKSGSGSLRERLAFALRDPTLELAYLAGEPPVWFDESGAPQADSPHEGRSTTFLPGPAGEPLARLCHRPGALEDPELASQIARATGLVLAHERLRVESLVQLDTLRASRIRIVNTADAERERLERDLHDGAQQRLVSLAITLRLAAPNTPVGEPSDSVPLASAQQELTAALAELRAIAHGLYPAVLREQGLPPALDALSESSPVPLRLTALPDERLGIAVERAAYFVVSEALRTARRVTVGAAVVCGTLSLMVEREGTPLELTPLEDRIGALGGVLRSFPLEGERAQLLVELPCGS